MMYLYPSSEGPDYRLSFVSLSVDGANTCKQRYSRPWKR